MAIITFSRRHKRHAFFNIHKLSAPLAALIASWVFAAVFVSTPVWADDSKTVVTKHGDWSKVCNTQCVIAQGLQHPDNPKVIYSSQVSYVSGSNEPVMQFNLPLGIYLPPGIAISIGEEQHKTPVAVCLPEGCKVLLVLTPAIMRQLQNNASYAVKMFVSEQTPRQLTFSLRGFNDAMASLAKTHTP